MVVLHTQERYATLARHTLRDLCREVVRVHIAGHGLRLEVEELCKMRELLLVAVPVSYTHLDVYKRQLLV